jgi:hypothetical protein
MLTTLVSVLVSRRCFLTLLLKGLAGWASSGCEIGAERPLLGWQNYDILSSQLKKWF